MSSVRSPRSPWISIACSAVLALTAGCSSPDTNGTTGTGGEGTGGEATSAGGAGGETTSSAAMGGAGGDTASCLPQGGFGGAPPGNSIESDNGGMSTTVVDAISYRIEDAYGSSAEIFMSDRPDLCARLNAGLYYFDEHIMHISLFTLDKAANMTYAPTEPGGTYCIKLGEGPKAAVNFTHVDSMCSLVGNGTVLDSGSITLDAIDNEAYSGHGAFTMQNGNHLVVQFAPKECGVSFPSGFSCQ